MSTRYANAVLDSLLATLRKVDGSGDYVNDLTAAGNQAARVYKGLYEAPPVRPIAPVTGASPAAGRPVVCGYFAGHRVTQGDSMQAFTVEHIFLVRAWVAGSPRHPDDRMKNAADLLNDLSAALTTNIGLTHTSTALPGYSSRNLVRSLEWVGDSFDGEGNASENRYGQQFGETFLTVTATWREARPVQAAAP